MISFQDDNEFDEFRNFVIKTITVLFFIFKIVFWSIIAYLIYS